MLNYLLSIIFVNFILTVWCKFPSYVHEHSAEQISETNDALLHTSSICKVNNDRYNNLIIGIKTAPGHRNQRNILRQTWLTDGTPYKIPYVFVMGSPGDQNKTNALRLELETYKDLLVGRSMDNYYNLTLKVTFLLSWTKRYCPDRWLLYVDDDAIVNVKKVLDLIALVQNTFDYSIYCHICRMPVVRHTDSKWFVPSTVWRPGYYPEYCHGFGYLIPATILPLLHDTAINDSIRPKLWIDDVFITGIVTKAAGIKVTQSVFRWSHSYNIEDFNSNIVLAEVGRHDAFLRKWLIIKGNSTLYNKIPSVSLNSTRGSTMSTLEHSVTIQKSVTILSSFQSFTRKYLGKFVYELVLLHLTYTTVLLVVLYKLRETRLRILRC